MSAARADRPSSRSAIALLSCAIYWSVCVQPVWHTDIWGHLSYGKLLWERGALPREEPLLPLAVGMPFVDTAWLSQVICYGVISGWGLAGLQGLTAICATVAAGLFMTQVHRATRRWELVLLAVIVFLWFEWYQLVVLRPELFGLVAYAWLFNRLTARRRPRELFVIPLLFAIWANLHGSFVVGLGLLGSFTIGRAVDVVRRTGRPHCVLHDGKLRHFTGLIALSVLATFVNPYGPRLYRGIWAFSTNPNLQSIAEWQPLAVRSAAGISSMLCLAALSCLYRWSPRRIRGWEPITLIGLTVAVFWTSRMMTWWTPVAVYLLAVHFHAVGRTWWCTSWQPTPLLGQRADQVVAIGLILICFGVSPFGQRLLRGKEPDLKQAVSEFTPLGAVEFLREHPPRGQVFNVYEWGDYLQWAGPAGIRVFVNSHAHSVPRQVWFDYLLVVQRGSGWEQTLDQYGVETIVMDRFRHSKLIQALSNDSRWDLVYEDRLAAVFFRRPVERDETNARL